MQEFTKCSNCVNGEERCLGKCSVIDPQLLKKFPESLLTSSPIYCNVHMSPLLVPIRGHINRKIIPSVLILSSHLFICLPNVFFPSDFPNKVYRLVSSVRATCLARLILLDMITVITFRIYL
jgi:hypothetical protein